MRPYELWCIKSQADDLIRVPAGRVDMHALLGGHVDNQRKAIAGRHRPIGWLGERFEVISGQARRVSVRPIRGLAQGDHDARHGEPLLVRLLEEALRHPSLGIENKRARIRDSIKPDARRLLTIQQVVFLDDDRPLVRQYRKFDTARVGETCEGVDQAW